jgi:predicted phage baseplate assembly protein
MNGSTALMCRTSQRRDKLQAENARRDENERFNGIEYAEFESGDNFDHILVDFLCPVPHPKRYRLDLWDETLRKAVEVDFPHERLTHKRIRVTPTSPLCPGRNYILKVRKCRGIDPQFATYRFTTTTNVLDVDPAAPTKCAPRKRADSQSNYLARDFSSFRQLLFDRLALNVPDWKERHIPDVGVTLIELLAYVGDYLCYFQDAVGTEAYLHTARQRQSVRRHARLVDYQLDEGCNARAFVQINVSEEVTIDTKDAFFITEHPDPRFSDQVVLDEITLERIPTASFQAFEPMRLPALPSQLASNDIKNPNAMILYLAGDERPGTPEIRALGDALSKQLSRKLMDRLRTYAQHPAERPPQDLLDDLVDALNSILGQCCLHENLGLARPHNNGCCCNSERTGRLELQDNTDLLRDLLSDYVASQGLRKRTLYEAHNCIAFYAWDQRECCLPIGATRAVLRDRPCESGTLVTLKLPVQIVGPNSKIDHNGGPIDCNCTDRPDNWRLKHLSCGDVLVFEEVLGPHTHEHGDADLAHRQAVRLTCVRHCYDPITNEKIVEIEWDAADALRFPLCISSVAPTENGCEHNGEISVARGNILLVDHGRQFEAVDFLGVTEYGAAPPACASCENDEGLTAPSRARLFRPVVRDADLTFASKVGSKWSASHVLEQDPSEALPTIDVFGLPVAEQSADTIAGPRLPPPTLVTLDDLEHPLELVRRHSTRSKEEQRRIETMLSPNAARFLQQYRNSTRVRQLETALNARESQRASAARHNRASNRELTFSEFDEFARSLREAVEWRPKSHLLASEPGDQHVVIEMDDERHAHLRFGDNQLGRRPPAGLCFLARYRRGSGIAGNVGAEAIKHAVFRRQSLSGIVSARNPLPASYGTEPESVGHAKWHAPQEFKILERAITADDYVELVRRDFSGRVQQAHASLHWTGTNYEIDLAVDPVSTEPDIEALLDQITSRMQRYRRIGHYLRVSPPRYVGLQIDMVVCIKAGHLRAHIRQTLLDRFSNRVLSDGSLGYFHPDNFTFGDSLYLSRLVSEAKQVEGVENVDVTRFERYAGGDQGELDAAVMRFGPLEIPRLDNDCDRPEFGRFCLDVRGRR